MTMFEIGALCRGFLLALSKLEVNGLEQFTELLDSRRDPSTRTRGLITGSFVNPDCLRLTSFIDRVPFFSVQSY